MPLTWTVTDAGRAALLNAQNNGLAPVTITEFGLTETAIAPAVTDIALAGEVKRIATLSGDLVDDDTIHLIVRDESADTFTMQGMALYLDDGTLFAIYGQADAILTKTADSVMLLAVDIRFSDVNAASLTFGDTNFLNPPATVETSGVVELATAAETEAGADSQRAVTPAGLLAAFNVWMNANLDGAWTAYNDGAGSGLDADLWRGLTPDEFLTNSVTRALILSLLEYTPVNKAGDTMEGPLILSGAPTADLHAATKQYIDGLVTASALLTKIGSVDGSGSGLDADLWRGQTPSQFLDAYITASRIKSELGYTPVDRSGDSMTGRLTLSSSPTSNMHAANKSYVDNLVSANALFAKIKTKDGSGSGLDADLLDGKQGSDYVSISSQSLGSSGYRIYSDGFKECWGRLYVGANSTASESFPFTFGSWNNVTSSSYVTANKNTADDVGITSKSLSGFNASNYHDRSLYVEWHARGV